MDHTHAPEGSGGEERKFLDIDEVRAEIRERLRGRTDLQPRAPETPGLSAIPARSAAPVTRVRPSAEPERAVPLRLAATEELWSRVLLQRRLIGDMPPAPPTLRGRVGAQLVAFVQRSLFWLIPQLRQFQVDVANAAKEQTTALQQSAGRGAALEARIDALEAGALDALKKGAIEAIERQLPAIQFRTEALAEHLESVANRLAATEAAVVEIPRLDELTKMLRVEVTRLKTSGVPATSQPAPAPAAEEKNVRPEPLDASYVGFQRTFRGSYEDIKDRLRVYLDQFEGFPHGTAVSPIVDFGCGRGEWLELLRERGMVAYGVDSNRGMVEFCTGNGLMVQYGDLLGHLQALPPESRGGITAFHVIEHLPADVLEAFLDEAMRVLLPEGILILETPNPSNVFVGVRTFHLDPTHQKPLPAELTRFLFDGRGGRVCG